MPDLPSVKKPAYLAKAEVDPRAGHLEDEGGIISPPRLKLLQGTAVEITEGKGANGDFWSQAHAASLGGEIHIIPLRWEREWLEFFGEEEEENGLKWRSTDAHDPRVLALGEDEWKFRVLNLLCLCPIKDKAHPPKAAILTFTGHGFKVGRSMYTESTRGVDAPLQAQVFKLGSDTRKTGGYTYRVLSARVARGAEEPEHLLAREIYRSLADQELTPNYEENTTKDAGAEVKDDIPF